MKIKWPTLTKKKKWTDQLKSTCHFARKLSEWTDERRLETTFYSTSAPGLFPKKMGGGSYLAYLSVLAYFSNLACLRYLANFCVLTYFSYLSCLSVLAYFCVLAYFSYLWRTWVSWPTSVTWRAWGTWLTLTFVSWPTSVTWPTRVS